MTPRQSKYLALSFLFIGLAAPAGVRPAASSPTALEPIPIDGGWIAKWREDLAVAKKEMPETHVRIDHTTPLSELEEAIDDLARRIPTLDHHQAVVELARIVAMIGDGHTRLTLPIDPASGFVGGHTKTEEATLPGTPFHHYPVRFFLYEDGLAVEEIAAEHRSLLGARVVRIGSMSTEDAMKAVEPTIHRDNPMQVRNILPRTLVIPELLHAQGVIDRLGPLALELETPAGEFHRLSLEPVPMGETVEWAERGPASIPLFRRQLDQNYRFEHFEDERAIYFRYVAVQNATEGESLAEFSERMFSFIETHGVERLILDLRGNGGGNNWLNAPLERGVMRAESLWRPGGLVAIADRMTFSAAMNFLSFLSGTTPAIIVGEAAGSRPNHYGDSRKLQLPDTGLTIRLSTRYSQDGGPADEREQITPHIQIPLTAADIRTGRDPVLEEILSWNQPGDPAGSWTGPATMRRYATTMSVELERSYGGWSGDFNAPGWFEPTAISNGQLNDGELQFDLQLETTTIHVRAQAAGSRLLGMFDYQGQWYPFAASKADPTPSSRP